MYLKTGCWIVGRVSNGIDPYTQGFSNFIAVALHCTVYIELTTLLIHMYSWPCGFYIILYADVILLLSPSVSHRQKLLHNLFVNETWCIRPYYNTKKLAAYKFGSRITMLLVTVCALYPLLCPMDNRDEIFGHLFFQLKTRQHIIEAV